MYICSSILFFSSITVLYIGIKNCSKTIEKYKNYYKNYYKLLSILNKKSNEDFIDHHLIQNDINKEIKNYSVSIKSN